ncbi:MAG TPA: FAD-binding oxidoreductase [Planctomycetota bacterium]|nr:FAD-binding oxidoreductase [Planctomycetota bacterium]
MELELALEQWTTVLGAERVSAEMDTRQTYARSTQPTSSKPAAVLFPRNTAEVREVVRIASEHGVPLYPISRGCNWGYGDACATTAGQVIVDLRQMNRIIEVNEKLAYAVIEPGVTQGQLAEYLAKNHPSLWLDVTGAGPDASVVGNTLERGFGHTPCGDHFQMSAGYQIVLADGRVLNTGFGHFDRAAATHAFKSGVGPALDGLFTQSNLGIVTRMGVWLLQKPEHVEAFAFSAQSPEQISDIVEALRPLRMAGLIQSTVHIANDLRIISSRARYPWEAMKGETPISPELRRKMCRDIGMGAWNVLGAMYGTRETVAATKKAVRKAFKSIARVRFFSEETLNFGERVASVLSFVPGMKRIREQIRCTRPAFDLLKGVPSPKHLSGAGWRSREPFDAQRSDFLDNNWGLMWLSPVLPATGEAALAFTKLIEPLFARHGFEPLVTITSITPRALCAVMTISFDKTNPAETVRARACYAELYAECAAAGFHPYRVGVHSMQKLHENSEVFWDVAGQIKQALDPNQIIAPGRYIPVQKARPRSTSSRRFAEMPGVARALYAAALAHPFQSKTMPK